MSFWSHMQLRRECSSELSCVRSEGLLTAINFITREVINPGVHCTGLFSPSHIALRYIRIVVSHWTCFMIALLKTPLHLHCLLILILNPLVGCDWLLFLLVCQSSYVPLLGSSVIHITIRIWVSYQFSSMVSFVCF
jgi:hypothetical protein